jgi:hypothetical protein
MHGENTGGRLSGRLRLSHFPAKFVPAYSSERGFQRFLFAIDESAKGFIYEGLVIPAACVIDPPAEPVQNVLIEADRYPRREAQTPQRHSAWFSPWPTKYAASGAGNQFFAKIL